MCMSCKVAHIATTAQAYIAQAAKFSSTISARGREHHKVYILRLSLFCDVRVFHNASYILLDDVHWNNVYSISVLIFDFNCSGGS